MFNSYRMVTSLFVFFITCIIRMCSEKKMRRINTIRDVAFMQNKLPIRDSADIDFEGHTVGINRFVIAYLKSPIGQ